MHQMQALHAVAVRLCIKDTHSSAQERYLQQCSSVLASVAFFFMLQESKRAKEKKNAANRASNPQSNKHPFPTNTHFLFALIVRVWR